MTTSIIPLTAVPDQVVQVSLGGQNCVIRTYQKTTGVFVDVYVAGTPIRLGVRALNLVKLVRSKYIGFVGELYFFDTRGTQDPEFKDIGDRYVLIYGSS